MTSSARQWAATTVNTLRDERNLAVLKLMEMAIHACRRLGKYIGICGQAPSDYPEITRWLVQQGIDSISLNPDSVLHMTEMVLKMEQERAGQYAAGNQSIKLNYDIV